MHDVGEQDGVTYIVMELVEGAPITRFCTEKALALAELEADPGRVREILGAGADKARAIARETMREVREVMNIPTRESV